MNYNQVLSQKQFNDYILIGNGIGTSELTVSEVYKVFKGQRNSWTNGNAVSIVLPSTKSLMSEKIAKLLYNSSTAGMQRFWLSLVFQGRANPPFFIDTSEETIKFVERTIGAIAFVPKSYETALSGSLIITIR